MGFSNPRQTNNNNDKNGFLVGRQLSSLKSFLLGELGSLLGDGNNSAAYLSVREAGPGNLQWSYCVQNQDLVLFESYWAQEFRKSSTFQTQNTTGH